MTRILHDTLCQKHLFESFFKKHSETLHQYLFYKYGAQLNPQDKMQDAFITLWQNCNKVGLEKAKSYVYTVANNLMLNEVAHQKVVFRHRAIKPKDYTNESPEFVLEEKQYAEKLEIALSRLTEAQRVAFLMNRVEGKRFKEIAIILNISTKAVEKRIYGALKKLREHLEEL